MFVIKLPCKLHKQKVNGILICIKELEFLNANDLFLLRGWHFRERFVFLCHEMSLVAHGQR